MRKQFKLMLGDNISSLKTLPDNSIDSIVSDPPYGLSFMGKKWDYDVPSVEFWKEVYRVLKPGGHVLSFGGTRTYHRMVVNIEDAGFEIRDQIQWLYGSGFPKSHNIGKAVDKINEVEGEKGPLKRGGESLVYDSTNYGDVGWDATKREPYTYISKNEYGGWGTAIKPANEPICVARKPLSEKTVALNVLKWGTGGINIDGCRIPSENNEHFRSISEKRDKQSYLNSESLIPTNSVEGRFPANIILDESAADLFEQSKFFYIPKVNKRERNMGLDISDNKKNTHPTIKPVQLMTYLCRLVTPPNGIVLDPFMGSGSTGISACLEGFRFIGMEMDENYFKIAERRINNYEMYREFLDKKKKK